MPSVMIVPGIGGNELHTLSTFFGIGPPQTIWLNQAVILLGGWRWLWLAPDGLSPRFAGLQPLFPGCPLPKYYAAAETYFSQRGYNVRGARLDWRGTIAASAAALVDRLRLFAAEGPFHLLAHSRGGLVTRAALAMLGQAEASALVGRVAGVGVPHFGSIDAAGLLAGWEETTVLLNSLLTIIYGALGGAVARAQLQQAINSWPSVYQLLPSPLTPGITQETINAIYDPAGWAAIGVPVSGSWLAAAEQSWQSLAPPPPWISWLNVVGSGFRTAAIIRGPRPPGSAANVVWSSAGDGSVMADTAAWPGLPTLYFSSAHSALPSDGSVLAAVDQFFAAGAAGAAPAQPRLARPRACRSCSCA